LNRTHAFVLVLTILIALSAVTIKPVNASEDSWIQKAPMHVARSDLGIATVNGKIYAIGGSTESGATPNRVGTDYDAKGWIASTTEEYDPETNTWALKAPMPTARYGFAIAAYQNKIYCIGGVMDYKPGYYITVTKVNEAYDPATNTWETKAPLPTGNTQEANVVKNKIYLIGGGPNGTENEVYDPAKNTWSAKASMPTNFIDYVSVVADNKIFVFGTTANQGTKTEIYDPETDTWNLGISPPLGISGGAAATSTGAFASKQIMVLCQNTTLFAQPQSSTLMQIYNFENESWSFDASSPTNRVNFGVAVVEDKLYVIGGKTYNYPYPDDTYWIITQNALNEQYTPAGYGTPDPTYQKPTPTPFPTPAPASSQSPTQTPTRSPSSTSPTYTTTHTATPSPTPTLQPSPSNSAPQADNNSGSQADMLWIGAATVVAVILLTAVAAAFFRKKKTTKSAKMTY
jgi:N-acetylneuraminic acid mutarotase